MTASEVQVSYDLAREDSDLTAVSVTRVFENGFKVLLQLQGDDAVAFIDAWNARPGAAATAVTPSGSAVAMWEALEEIVSWKHDALGTRPYPQGYDASKDSAFDRGTRMAFYRCADRASAALAAAPQPQEGGPVAWLYELAHYIKPSDEDPHRDWRLVVTITPPPTIPKDGVRNIQPLYTSISRPQQLPQK